MMYWTKVTDALPPDGEEVMVTIVHEFENKKSVAVAGYDATRGMWRKNGLMYYTPNDYCAITHWAPMPAPAEDEEDL